MLKKNIQIKLKSIVGTPAFVAPPTQGGFLSPACLAFYRLRRAACLCEAIALFYRLLCLPPSLLLFFCFAKKQSKACNCCLATLGMQRSKTPCCAGEQKLRLAFVFLLRAPKAIKQSKAAAQTSKPEV
jgi:hypothetical protein